jgi:hypothetical protein
MKATHIDYKHPRHLRVVTGQPSPAWGIGRGVYQETALCVAPGSKAYAQSFRSGLPKWGDANG